MCVANCKRKNLCFRNENIINFTVCDSKEVASLNNVSLCCLTVRDDALNTFRDEVNMTKF